MNAPFLTTRAQERDTELPAGYLEYHARNAIRDLIRLYGFEGARELVAGFLNDEADRRRVRQ